MSANEIAAENERLKKELRDCRNSLCFLCGEYKTAYKGSCDGCRWNKTPEIVGTER